LNFVNFSASFQISEQSVSLHSFQVFLQERDLVKHSHKKELHRTGVLVLFYTDNQNSFHNSQSFHYSQRSRVWREFLLGKEPIYAGNIVKLSIEKTVFLRMMSQ